MTNSKNTLRHGFSLIEVLVVLGIISILVALILPAVQMSRAAALRLKGENSLRQLGMAALNHQSSQGHFPSGELSRPFPGGPSGLMADGSVRHSWCVFLLPYLEQRSVSDRYNLQRNWSSSENQPVVNTTLAVLLSPNAPGGERIGQIGGGRTAAISDYHPIRGVASELTAPMAEYGGLSIVPPADYRGVFQENHYTRPSEIVDGMSQTILFIESAGGPDIYRLGQRVGSGSSVGFSPFDPKSAFLVHGTCDLGGHYPGPFWNASNLGGPDGEAYGFHPNVILASFADGSVHRLKKEMDIRVFVRLVGMRDGGAVAIDE